MTGPLIHTAETFWLTPNGWELSDDGDAAILNVRRNISDGPTDHIPLIFPFEVYRATLFTAEGASGPSLCRMENMTIGPGYYIAAGSRTLREWAALFKGGDDQPD